MSCVKVRPVNILLVEDDDDDVLLIERNLRKCSEQTVVSRAEDGIDALQFLRRQGPYQHAPRPDLIILDLNMPRMDGREVLRAIREDVELRPIPIVVLTTSENMTDVMDSYSYRANCYITKPVDLKRLRHVMKSITDYWCSLVKLPSQAAAAASHELANSELCGATPPSDSGPAAVANTVT